MIPFNTVLLDSSFCEADFYAFNGLGHAVDASDPAPLGHHRREVRSILSDMSNVGEGIKKEKHAYTETISSLVSRRSSVTASVSDLVGKVLTLSAEAEYMREHSKEMEINGNNTENDL